MSPLHGTATQTGPAWTVPSHAARGGEGRSPTSRAALTAVRLSAAQTSLGKGAEVQSMLRRSGFGWLWPEGVFCVSKASSVETPFLPAAAPQPTGQEDPAPFSSLSMTFPLPGGN